MSKKSSESRMWSHTTTSNNRTTNRKESQLSQTAQPFNPQRLVTDIFCQATSHQTNQTPTHGENTMVTNCLGHEMAQEINQTPPPEQPPKYRHPAQAPIQNRTQYNHNSIMHQSKQPKPIMHHGLLPPYNVTLTNDNKMYLRKAFAFDRFPNFGESTRRDFSRTHANEMIDASNVFEITQKQFAFVINFMLTDPGMEVSCILMLYAYRKRIINGEWFPIFYSDQDPRQVIEDFWDRKNPRKIIEGRPSRHGMQNLTLIHGFTMWLAAYHSGQPVVPLNETMLYPLSANGVVCVDEQFISSRKLKYDWPFMNHQLPVYGTYYTFTYVMSRSARTEFLNIINVFRHDNAEILEGLLKNWNCAKCFNKLSLADATTLGVIGANLPILHQVCLTYDEDMVTNIDKIRDASFTYSFRRISNYFNALRCKQVLINFGFNMGT